MSRYDGLIIPRSYSEYINKTDAATLQQALQLSSVLSNAVAAGDNKAVKSGAVFDYNKTIAYTEYNDANLCIPDNFETKRYLLGSTALNTPEADGCLLESSVQYYSNSNYKSIVQKCYINSTTTTVNKVYVRTGKKEGVNASWAFGAWKILTTVDNIEVTAAADTTIIKNSSNIIGKQVSLTFRFNYTQAVQNGNTYKIATISKYKPSESYPAAGMYGYNVVLFYINTDGEIFARPLLNNPSLDGGVCINYCID